MIEAENTLDMIQKALGGGLGDGFGAGLGVGLVGRIPFLKAKR